MIGDLLCVMARLICGLSVHWKGIQPDDRQRIYFANHTSHMDFIALWAALPKPLRRKTRPVAARDYWEFTAFRRWLAHRVINAVLIERHKITEDNNPIVAMSEALKQGYSLILFPEGTRTLNGELGHFKSGLFHLGKQAGDVEMIPVYLENLNRVLPKGEFLLIPILGSLTFGAPLKLREDEGKADFLNRARQGIEELKI